MDPNDYQERAMAKEANQEDLRDWVYQQGIRATRMQNGLNGLVDEVGELADAVKGWLEYKRQLDGVNLLEEVGDCLWRLAQVSKAGGFTLEDAMKANLRKLETVRYKDTVCKPHEESDRDRVAERDALVTGRPIPDIDARKVVETVVNCKSEDRDDLDIRIAAEEGR